MEQRLAAPQELSFVQDFENYADGLVANDQFQVKNLTSWAWYAPGQATYHPSQRKSLHSIFFLKAPLHLGSSSKACLRGNVLKVLEPQSLAGFALHLLRCSHPLSLQMPWLGMACIMPVLFILLYMGLSSSNRIDGIGLCCQVRRRGGAFIPVCPPSAAGRQR
jgi:hypothetical protein